jgi:hypothetical protein
VLRRIVSAAVAAVALLAAFGCGGSGNDVSVGTGTKDPHRQVQPADDAATAAGLKTVKYQGIAFDVPAGWPVYDLAAAPTTCVRFDVNAVYLGEPSDEMQCPAGVVGRADAILVEPAADASAAEADPSAAPAVSAASASGLELAVATDTAQNQVDATVPSAGVTVTAAYQDSDATVQQIVQSLRVAS